MERNLYRFIRIINKLLIFLIILFCGLYILYPVPVEGNISVRAKYWLAKTFDQSEYNRLYIPSIGVDMKVLEGDFDSAISRGAWRDPETEVPNKGGNTVIAAHRFQYTSGPETFYRLDELSEDDVIKIKWEGEVFHYRVYSTGVVSKNAVEILQNNGQEILTLYTCHPLWTSDKRLVVRAVRV